MFRPTASYQEDPRIAEIDETSTLALLKLRTMSRAAAKDRPRMRAELLQSYVDKAMAMADTLDN